MLMVTLRLNEPLEFSTNKRRKNCFHLFQHKLSVTDCFNSPTIHPTQP